MLLSRNQILHIFLRYDYGMEIGKHTVQVLLYEASRHVNYHRAAPGGWTKQAPLSRWSDLMIFFLSLFLSSVSLSLSLFLVQDESTVQTEGLNAVTRK